jgi:hypothetical protein
VAVRGSVAGRAQLREVITKLEVSAPAELEKRILTGTREAVKEVKPKIVAAALAKLPKRKGYAALVARSIKVSSRVTGGKTVVAVIRATASGKRENRDLPALNRGILRHPFMGNRRRWYTQRVKPGVVDDPIDETRDQIIEVAQDAANAYRDSIVRG